MQAINGLRLSTKVAAALATAAAVLICASGVYHFALQATTSGYTRLLAHEEALKSDSLEIGYNMLTARRHEKDFLLQKDWTKVAAVDEALAHIETHAEAIAAQASTDDGDEVRVARAIRESTATYKTAFHALADAWQRRGLDHESGLQGEFRGIVRDLEAQLAECDVAGIEIALLQMRRCEKDFVLRKDASYVAKMDDAVAELRTQLTASGLSAEDKSAIEGQLAGYAEAFAGFARDTLAGAVTTEHDGAFRTAAHAIEESVDARYVPDIMVDLLTLRRHEKDYLLRLLPKYVESVDQTLGKLRAGITASQLPAARQQALARQLDSYQQGFHKLVDEDGKIAGLTEQMRAAIHQLEPIVAKNVDDANDAMIATSAQLTRDAARSVKVATAVLALAVMVAAALGLAITRSITRPLRSIFRGLSRFSTLELQATSQVFNHVIDGLTTGIEEVDNAAGQVAMAAQQLAQSASEQASSVEESSSALEEMAAMTRQNADHAHQAQKLVVEAHKSAESGDLTMTAINASADQISRIIKVIEEIAFQTNLLALNAAVEAARAGEHGKGFAVVADEVRQLAQRAATASQETNGLIGESISRSREGAVALRSIVGGVGQLATLIDGIAKSSREQALGVDQINQGVSQIDRLTQSTAAGAEESASAAEQLSAQSASSRGLVGELIALARGN